jgi:DnaB helicase-like protein
MKQSSHESQPESPHLPTGHGTAHVDDIVEPEGEESTPQPSEDQPPDLSAGFLPKWTVIAEEDIVQSHPHLAAETVLLVSVIADNSLLDQLSTLVVDCFYSVSHQAIFTAMLALQSRGVAISPSTIESECAARGKSDSLPTLTGMSSLVPLLAVDRATFYRYIGIVKYQWLTRGLRWYLQMTMDSSARGASPVDLISRLQRALSELNEGYAYLNRNATIERQESGYDNDAEIVAASRCTLGNFDS